MSTLNVDLDLVRKYNVPGPRYTSYPPATHFTDAVSADQITEKIRANNETQRDLSLYYHIPFCRSLCWYCGCTTVITTQQNQSATYLDYIGREMVLLGKLINPKRKVVQLAFGGGTPTFLTPSEIRRLGAMIHARFDFDPNAEAGVEIDPRRMTWDHATALREVGFNRASIGVQDNNPEVQKAVHRIQPFDQTKKVVDWIRAAGFNSLNIDLIYGLPHQTATSFEKTLDEVLTLNPNRFAVFSYAHVPWIKPAQRIFTDAVLPSADLKLQLLKLTIEKLTSEGYVYIGMDHFARADDELAIAQSRKTLQRNFQGYSTHGGADIYSFGMSSISQTEACYWQNVKELPEYYAAIDSGKLPFAKGYLSTHEDQIRRHTIMRLMCDLGLDYAAMSQYLETDFATHFASELASLDDLEADGLIQRTPKGMLVTELGRLFIRNIAMRFDAYRKSEEPAGRFKDDMKTVAIIGAGITGLTAAYRLRQAGVAVTVYEGSQRVGGVIQSVRQGGFLAECGPNSILETSPKIASLIKDAGLENRRFYSDPGAEKRYLVRNGKPVAVPCSFGGFIGTPLFSPGAKLRLFREPFIRRCEPGVEESIAEFVERRLGREFLDYAIDPLVAGVYAGDPAHLSVKEAFPKLYALEQKHGSLIVGQFLGARERKRRAEVSKQNAKKISFDNGLQVLVDTLHASLGEAVHLGSPVDAVCAAEDGWTVSTGDEITEHSAVLYAGTAGRLAQMQISARGFPSLAPLAQVNHPPVASIVLGFRRQDVAHPLDGFGMLIPRVERCNTLGTLFSSSLFPQRAPVGHVTLTSYIGGARNPDLPLKDPATLIELALQDLRKLVGLTGKPVFQHHFVYRQAIPQYDVGFGKMRDLMKQAESAAPGLFLAGHYRDGISLGDSIVSGHDVAARILQHLKDHNGRNAHVEIATPLAA